MDDRNGRRCGLDACRTPNPNSEGAFNRGVLPGAWRSLAFGRRQGSPRVSRLQAVNNELRCSIRKISYWMGRLCAGSTGVISAGRSKEETQRLIREAIAFHLEGLK